MLRRIRWANVARLVFVAVAAAVLAKGLPAFGGGTRNAPDLGLPESVLRPPVPAVAPRASRPLSLERTAEPKGRLKRGSERRSVRPRTKRPRHSPREADPSAGSVPAAAAYVTPPAAGVPAVGEFGP